MLVDTISKLAPEFTPIKTLDDTINELKIGIEKYASNLDNFRNSNLIRFNVLNSYIENRKYNEKLFLKK